MTYPHALSADPASLGRLNLISLASMASALRLERGATASVGDVVRGLGVVPRHEWLVGRWLRALASAGVVEFDGDAYRVVGDVPCAESEELASLQARQRYPLEVALLHRATLANLPRLLRDELDVADLVASPGTAHGVMAGERLCRFSDELDAACAEVVRSAVRCRGRLVRVVEIGGGMGRTTDAVLKECPAAADHYLFTDTSPVVLRGAAETCPDLWTAQLDVNASFEQQGLAPASADVVIAGHALHHAVNIGRALTRIRDLLAPEGELVFTTPVGDDPVSLTSTHFLHSPRSGDEVRRGGDLFPAERTWRSALYAAGFTLLTTVSAGGKASPRHHLFHAAREAV